MTAVIVVRLASGAAHLSMGHIDTSGVISPDGPAAQGTGGSQWAGTFLGGGVSPSRHEIHGSEAWKAAAQNTKE